MESSFVIPQRLLIQIQTLKDNRSSGARRCALQALSILRETPPRLLREVSQAVIRTHPEMVVIARVIELCLESVFLPANASKSPEQLLESATYRVEQTLVSASHQIAQHAAQLAIRGSCVLTHSWSGTVEEALVAAHRSHHISVLATESQPGGEGRRLVEKLNTLGLKASTIPDSEIAQALQKCQVVWIGADAILNSSFINKTGTAALLNRARAAKVQTVLLADTFKSAPEDWKVPLLSPDFEEIPLGLIDLWISETGASGV